MACQECGADHPQHRWGSIRAHAAGWFMQNDGREWCPRHVPEWVEGWRQRRDIGDVDLNHPPCEGD